MSGGGGRSAGFLDRVLLRLYEKMGRIQAEDMKRRAHIGERVRLDSPVFFRYPENIWIDDDVSINRGLVVIATASVRIGRWTAIGPNVMVVTANHDYRKYGKDMWDGVESKEVIIGKNCWIGAGAIILPGVRVGDGCVVGAGSVVSRDLPADAVCLGVPARPKKQRNVGTRGSS